MPSSTSTPTLSQADINALQPFISTGEDVLAKSEGNEADNQTAFTEAKTRGTDAIAKGDYPAAIAALESTRQPGTEEFYLNAPEALIYLNNAYIENKSAYTIAVSAPISQLDGYGLGVLRGIALAQQEINSEKGGEGISNSSGDRSPVRVVLVDDQNSANPKLAELIGDANSDLKILGLIGHQTSDLTLALGEIYDQANLPVVTPSSTSTELFGKFSYVSLLPPSTGQMAHSLAFKINKNKAIVFYDSQEEFSQEFGDETCMALGSQCELWDFSEAGKESLNAERVEELVGRDSTALVIAFNASETSDNKARALAIIQAVSNLNKKLPNSVELFSGNALYDQNTIEEARNKEVSILRVSPWDNSLSDNLPAAVREENKQFLQKNRELWGTDQVN